MEPAHLVGTGGAIGAILRYLVGLVLPQDRFPFATLVVNVGGSFALGLVAFASLTDQVVFFLGTGACGSFTTYSSFSVQTVRFWQNDDRFRAILYAGGTLGLCFLAAAGGAGIATILQL